VSESLARVAIESVAAGGDGVGRTEGMVVFIPRTAPGDVALVRLARARRFARGEAQSFEVLSADRVEPPCPHYTRDRCGGCQIQHLAYEAQLRAKGGIVGEALRRIGRRIVEDPDVEPSDAEWRYRRKLTLHLRRSGTRWIAGLHPYDNPDAVFDLADCPITDEGVMAAWASIRPAFALLPRERALRMSVRLLEDGASAVVEGGRTWRDPEQLLEAVPMLREVWWRPEGGGARLVARRDAATASGASFAQVNEGVAARLREHVLARARAHHPDKVIDAYAGLGATTLPLAADGRAVIAIELDSAAVKSLSAQLRAPSAAIAGRVEDHLAALLPADVVLLNPPRGGVDSRVVMALQEATHPPQAVLYTSCDPATLGRDLARMTRYRLASVRAYDMFPQTAHVETVVELVPEAA
jgi:23S rRNA (uracil1939-C5)-methyltransferase